MTYAELQDKLAASEHKRSDLNIKVGILQKEVMVLKNALNQERAKVDKIMQKTAHGVLQDQIIELQDKVNKQSQTILEYQKREKFKEVSIQNIKDQIDASNIRFRNDIKVEQIGLENELKRLRL